MRLRKSVTFVTTAILFASMIAGPGSIGAAAAESTTADYAVSIALSDAGLSEDEVTIEDVEKGTEQGASVYEIEFWTDEKDYEYDIAVADGLSPLRTANRSARLRLRILRSQMPA